MTTSTSMEITDIKTIPITPDMLMEAETDAALLREKWGRGTRAATPQRDIIGSLAHQAVELQLVYMNAPFESTRTIKEAHGDKGDIFYDGDVIDVKGTRGTLNPFYYYNQQFLVFDKELAGMEDKGITHFVFVVVNLNENLAHIYGAISLHRFMNLARPVKLQWDNHGIRAYQLKSFTRYVNRI